MSENIGGALLRVIGSADRRKGEPNPASRSDAFAIIDGIMGSKEFRMRCGALSNLASDVPIEARKQACRALLILMQSTRDPGEPPPMTSAVKARPSQHFLDPKLDPELDLVIDYKSFRTTTPEYLALSPPRPNGRWSAHVEAKYTKAAVPDFVRVSPYMAELISAFESLFGIRGALLSG